MCSTSKTAIALKPPAKLKVRSASDLEFQSILRDSNDNVERLQQQRLQAFLDEEPEFEKAIEIEQLRYPVHLYEFKKALEQLANNQTLKVTSKSAALINDLAVSCQILDLPVDIRQFRRVHFLYATRQIATPASIHPIAPKSTSQTTHLPGIDKLSA